MQSTRSAIKTSWVVSSMFARYATIRSTFDMKYTEPANKDREAEPRFIGGPPRGDFGGGARGGFGGGFSGGGGGGGGGGAPGRQLYVSNVCCP